MEDDLPQYGELHIEVPTDISTVDVFGIYGPPHPPINKIQNNPIGARLIKANFQDRPIRVKNGGMTDHPLRASFIIETPICWDMIIMISEAQGCPVFYTPPRWRKDKVPKCSMVWPAELFSTVFEWKR